MLVSILRICSVVESVTEGVDVALQRAEVQLLVKCSLINFSVLGVLGVVCFCCAVPDLESPMVVGDVQDVGNDGYICSTRYTNRYTNMATIV